MNNIRNSIDSWTNRAFNIISWSSGLFLGFIGWWLINNYSISFYKKSFIVLAIILFGGLIQIYLLRVINAHRGNGKVLAKIEKTLRLTEKDFFIKNDSFFKYSDTWIKPHSLIILQILSLVIIVFTVLVVILF